MHIKIEVNPVFFAKVGDLLHLVKILFIVVTGLRLNGIPGQTQSYKVKTVFAESADSFLVKIYIIASAPDREVLVPDINNRSMRMMFMREMELSDRLRKLDDMKRILPSGKKMYETMLTLRFNAYRDMGHAVLYVAAVPEKSVAGAFYTPSALKAAAERRDAMRERSPFVTLCYPG